MGSPQNLARNCTFNPLSTNQTICSFDLNSDQVNELEHSTNLDKVSDANNMQEENTEDFEKSMEMVFEVGLLTIFGVAGVLGNLAAIILFSR